ncbi:MAG: hypothetical protein OZ948_06510 [Deltaproteobacteria bacterium]|nr:hypothetical protein [Deltaproteobacteria bacterium]
MAALLVLVVTGCGRSGDPIPPDPVEGGSRREGAGLSGEAGGDGGSELVAMLRGAPTEAALDATTRVELAPSMWADVGPSMPPREHPPAINGLVKVVATQGSLAGKGIAIDHVWIVKGNDVWEATDPPESDSQDPAYTDAQGVARNRPDSPEFTIALRAGPPWGAEGKIFVVVRIVTPGGTAFLLRAPEQPIATVE